MMAAINNTIHEQREIGFDKVLELDAAVTRVVLWSPEHGAAHHAAHQAAQEAAHHAAYQAAQQSQHDYFHSMENYHK